MIGYAAADRFLVPHSGFPTGNCLAEVLSCPDPHISSLEKNGVIFHDVGASGAEAHLSYKPFHF